jgi:hypothetical protein
MSLTTSPTRATRSRQRRASPITGARRKTDPENPTGIHRLRHRTANATPDRKARTDSRTIKRLQPPVQLHTSYPAPAFFVLGLFSTDRPQRTAQIADHGFTGSALLRQKARSTSPVCGQIRKRNFVGQCFWARGSFVSAIGRDATVIREYIKNREAEDNRLQQLTLWR